VWRAGVISFCAEANKLAAHVTSFDPTYSPPPEKILEQSVQDLESVYQGIERLPAYCCGCYKNSGQMRVSNEEAVHYLSLGLQHSSAMLEAGELPRRLLRGL
jgi:hypothetical protein